MQSRSFLTAVLTVVLAATALMGCSSLAPAGPGAVSVNLEVEDMQNKIALLNIARASMRRPPVYTTLSSVAGKVRPTGGLTLTVPFGPNLAGGSTGTAGLSLQANDAPTVTLSPLDTQEFYQGIMTPIKKETIDFYVQQGFSRALLFNLFISRIEVENPDNTIQVYRNYPGRDAEMIAFQGTLNELIRLGLTTELVAGKASAFGPLRTADEVRDLRAVASAAKSELSITEVAPCAVGEAEWRDLIARHKVKRPRGGKGIGETHAALQKKCTEGDNKVPQEVVTSYFPSSPAAFYRVEKPGGKMSVRLCFGDPSPTGGLRCSDKYKPGAVTTETSATTQTGIETVSLPAGTLKNRMPPLPNEQRSRPPSTPPVATTPAEKEKEKEKEKEQKISLVVRSTDAVIYYLGEVMRRQLYADGVESPDSEERAVAYHYLRGSGTPDRSCWETPEPNDPPCVPMLEVDTGEADDAFVSVDYDGQTFSIPSGRHARDSNDASRDRSSQVIAIVAQLLALNKSAKDTPQTSILQVVNP